ncbi:hypothetical protein ACFCXF_02450 [Streptomyces virginiae]|uniref:hypothetical protein n=1 Tax=Streptomyces virginiae TaxID=1961 RepID=UPI0035DF717E
MRDVTRSRPWIARRSDTRFRYVDFYRPAAEPTGEAASMELALATGRGPRPLTDPEGRGPLLRDEDVVAFGFRDTAESTEHGVRAVGATAAARRASDRLGNEESAGYWVHLDVTIFNPRLDPDATPAARLVECLGRVLRP